MIENGPKSTFWNHPRKALSSLKNRKMFLNLLRIFKLFKSNSGVNGLYLGNPTHKKKCQVGNNPLGQSGSHTWLHDDPDMK